ncbi:helicase-related protein [Kallotenue papyrolyticum]|uniref:helicase-related protein n=1 Tax=Kallotenue papyrolyticum TaxID=1325125 RepID=UPI000492B857|nr:DEAD/DEAH box helicase [Kallotenue papyrolyticum]
MPKFEVGSLVRVREREWVVLPSPRDDVLLLRPLGGAEAEICGIYRPLEEHLVSAADFPPPRVESAGDFESGRLLRDAARLALRSGAGPFRSLGRLGMRPRPYQLVPLIMALRLDPVRLLIADDVGIGKTVEAALIARELLDRGEIRRLTVLCPPHLCDQWQRELREKFAIDAVIVRSSTVAALERQLPRGDLSIFDYFPFTVASIDYVKHDRHRAAFVGACPELVIVDEAHTAARPGGRASAQQQRHDLVREIAARPERHLLLLTATPHSGIEESFSSLLGLLRPEFATLDLQRLQQAEREQLSRHFVQRRRADVKQWLGEATPFPEREWTEVTYRLEHSPQYRQLFEKVVHVARNLIGNARLPTQRQRVRYWAALALLRCVMSSPAAAATALALRAGSDPDRMLADNEDDELLGSAPPDQEPPADESLGSYVHDRDEHEDAPDVEPTHVIEEGSRPSQRATLRDLVKRAEALKGDKDPKLLRAQVILEALLRDGYHPIVYCRYIATAKYVAEELQQRLTLKDLRVLAVTGERSEEEREALVAELSASPRRLLVATDCLSEGINLQHAFDAVLHYDLPWNPNRLEQREGRVDRYGQPRATVRTVLFYGEDNPIDQAVMKVLLRKAVTIHRSLGIAVPLPINSETVLETLIGSLFRHDAQQLALFDAGQPSALPGDAADLEQVEQVWERAVERERQSRTRFAQRAIRPDEVARELEESDAVLGDPHTVRDFVLAACARLGAPLLASAPPSESTAPHTNRSGAAATIWRLDLPSLPGAIRERLAPLLRHGRAASTTTLLLTFDDLAAPGVEQVGRNHPLTTALADYLLETALTAEQSTPPAARCGVIRTRAVTQRTLLLLLRARMLIESARQPLPTLAEELIVCGVHGRAEQRTWLEQAEALELLNHAQPAASLTPDERAHHLQQALAQLPELHDQLRVIAEQRAHRLEAAHNRVRTATQAGRARVRPNLPPDVLGLYVLLPVIEVNR